MNAAQARGRTILGWALGVVAAVWLSTLRLTVIADPALEGVAERPWVLAFFHGTIWPLLAWRRRRPTAVLVSLSADGAMTSRALARLGYTVVRGSSSHGGARGLRSLVRLLRKREHDVAFAVDGPRGPAETAKPGALLAARAGGALVVPIAGAMISGKVLRSWDRFALAWPFSRVAVVLGEPIEPAHDTEIDLPIREAKAKAEAILAGESRAMLRSSRNVASR